MATRRTFLAGVAAALAAAGGCLDSDDTEGSETVEDADDAETADDAGDSAESTYRYRVAPARATDEHPPVLSTDEEAVAELEALVETIEEATGAGEVVYGSASATEAESFRELTADVERYPDGNPPGYYVEHDGETASVTLSGG